MQSGTQDVILILKLCSEEKLSIRDLKTTIDQVRKQIDGEDSPNRYRTYVQVELNRTEDEVISTLRI